MECPLCRFENPETLKFCGGCGARLQRICPRCRFENPFRYRFCGQCGQKLTTAESSADIKFSFENKLVDIQQRLAGELNGSIFADRHRIEGERKQVTVMFCDLEGFTAIAEHLDPEETYDIMDRVYELLIRRVHRYEGTVNEMTGDGIMALFGAPIAVENAPQRAVSSALAIHRTMVKLADDFQKQNPGLPKLRMRIEIHTGTVVVGTLGNDLRMEFKAVGNTVNLASRMEGLAEAGTTYVTEKTYKLTEGFFLFESLGEKQVKGIQKPVSVYHAIARSKLRTRFDINTARGLTPFVGRERELELMLDCFHRAKSGRGQVFSIVSQAGVGKSRLLYEFRKAIANEGATFLEGRCFSYSRNVAYHPIIDMLKMNFALDDTDDDESIRGKVRAGLKILHVDEATTLPYILELLSVRDSGIDRVNISREARKHLIIDAIKRIVLSSSKERPLILAFEDANWVDASTRDVAMEMVEMLTGTRVLFIFTYRPEFVNIWEAKPYHSRIALNRLSNRESLKMVSHLLGTENLHKDLEALILEKTEGIPFFIEEFVRSLIDLKIIGGEDGAYRLVEDQRTPVIPTTIQEVIMARVDVLPGETKAMLRTASVIEREFSHRLLKEVTRFTEKELLFHVSILKDAQLLYESGIYPDSSYVFKHALSREVLYNSLLHSQKTGLHEKVGGALEILHKDNMEDHYGVLVQHFALGNNFGKGAGYAKLAGRKAQKAASFVEAIAHARKRIECLAKLEPTEKTKGEMLDAGTALAGYYLSLSRFADAKTAIDSIADWADDPVDPRAMARIQIVLGLYSHWIEEDNQRARRFLTKALRNTSRTGDDVSMWFANFFLGIVLSWACEFDEGLKYFEKSLEMSEKTPYNIGALFARGNMSAFNYIFNGKIDLAYRTASDLLQLVEKSGDIYVKAMAYASYGASCFCRAIFDRSEQCLLIALSYCEKTALVAWQAWAAGFLGHTYTEIGAYEKAVAFYDQTISLMESGRLLPSWKNQIKIARERARILMNEPQQPFAELEAYYADIRINAAKGWAARHMGEILMHLDDPRAARVDAWFEKAIKEDGEGDLAFSLACDYDAFARWLVHKGDLERAMEFTSRAVEQFADCGADGWRDHAAMRLDSNAPG